MQLFSSRENKNSILGNLYTNKSSKWIIDLEDSEVVPFVIQMVLGMNDRLRVQTRWLDKYVFALGTQPKMFLSLAWSIIPKTDKEPFVKYISTKKDEEEFDFIIKKIRKHLCLSDNDWKANKERIIKAILGDTVNWFSFYGVEKKYWKKYQLPFNKLKEFGVKIKKPQKGLSAWGI